MVGSGSTGWQADTRSIRYVAWDLGSLFRLRDGEPGLGHNLQVERAVSRPRWSYFLRADTMHGLYGYLEDHPGPRPEQFHTLSHGEGFLEILRTRVNQPGF